MADRLAALRERLLEKREVAKTLAAGHAAYGGHLYSHHMGRMAAFDDAIAALDVLADESAHLDAALAVPPAPETEGSKLTKEYVLPLSETRLREIVFDAMSV